MLDCDSGRPFRIVIPTPSSIFWRVVWLALDRLGLGLEKNRFAHALSEWIVMIWMLVLSFGCICLIFVASVVAARSGWFRTSKALQVLALLWPF